MVALLRPSRAVLAVGLLACTSCRERAFEDLDICFPLASDRIVVEVSAACASDHRGAELSCDVEVDGTNVHVDANGHDGRDPDGACEPALIARCETEELPEGMYTVHFEDGTFEVAVPNSDEESCEEEI